MTPARILSIRYLVIRSLRRASSAVVLSVAALAAAAQNQLWLNQIETNDYDGANAVAPDGAGGVFVTGSTTGNLGGPNAGLEDAWLARYDGSGNQVWLRQFGTSHYDYAFAAASDGTGGVYVTGSTAGDLGGVGPYVGYWDVWLARYDSAGNQLWVRQFGTEYWDDAYAAASDGSGGVYITGWTVGDLAWLSAGYTDVWLAHFDSAGNEIWSQQFGTSSYDGADAAAPDGSGGVYVSDFTGDDAWLARYDSAGNQLWIRQFGTSPSAGVDAAAPDGSGGVFVTGYTAGSLGGPNAGNLDTWLARYDNAGNRLWIRQFGTSDSDRAGAAASDGLGGVFVSGHTEGALGGPNAGLEDSWLARYDSAGNQLWIQQFGTSDFDGAYAAASDGLGGVYVSGTTGGSPGSFFASSARTVDAWLARFDGSCGSGSTYCVASTTSISGCQAKIGATGSPSLANPSGFTISSGSVPGGHLGICFFGKNGAANMPFGSLGGRICVQAPLFRSAPKGGGGTHGNCDGAYSFTLQDLISVSPIVALGTTINAEIWARDPNNPDGFLLSDGLMFVVCP